MAGEWRMEGVVGWLVSGGWRESWDGDSVRTPRLHPSMHGYAGWWERVTKGREAGARLAKQIMQHGLGVGAGRVL